MVRRRVKLASVHVVETFGPTLFILPNSQGDPAANPLGNYAEHVSFVLRWAKLVPSLGSPDGNDVATPVSLRFATRKDLTSKKNRVLSLLYIYHIYHFNKHVSVNCTNALRTLAVMRLWINRC